MNWSHDETKLVYTAEKLVESKKKMSFWEASSNFNNNGKLDESFENVGKANEFIEDWGESYVGFSTSQLFVVDIPSKTITAIGGIPDGLAVSPFTSPFEDHECFPFSRQPMHNGRMTTTI